MTWIACGLGRYTLTRVDGAYTWTAEVPTSEGPRTNSGTQAHRSAADWQARSFIHYWQVR